MALVFGKLQCEPGSLIWLGECSYGSPGNDMFVYMVVATMAQT